MYDNIKFRFRFKENMNMFRASSKRKGSEVLLIADEIGWGNGSLNPRGIAPMNI